jgi:hypothetical protein
LSEHARFAALFACACAAVAPNLSSAQPSPRTIDDFADASAWTAAASDQVNANLRKTSGANGAAICLDFDFHGVSGYAAMHRPLHMEYPQDYEFDVRVRGAGPDNALQFKLADAKNENVWWVNRADFAFPRDWTEQRFKKREISFAWGPAADRALRSSESIEFTVYAVNGGRGEVCFDELVFRERSPPPALPPGVIVEASSAARGAPAAYAVDGNLTTAWRSDPRRGVEQSFTLDLGAEREFGGLVLHWGQAAFASRYDVELSDDAHTWRTVRRVTVGNGGVDPLYLPESESRYIRLALHGPNSAYTLDEIEIKDLAFGASANAFFAELAKSSPRGWYPRGFYDEQTYWTILGIDGGHQTGLFSEDGAIEVARGGFSLAPVLVDESGKVTTWADAQITHSLQDGYLPIPSVVWHAPNVALTTTAFALGKRDASQLVASYTVENTSDQSRAMTLALVAQPFQVNPAVQFLNTPGGVSPIHDLAFDGRALSVDGKPRVFALATPDVAFASPFDSGLAVEHLAASARLAGATEEPVAARPVHDETGLASGALLYTLALAPHSRATFVLAIPLDGPPQPPASMARSDAAGWLEAERSEVAAVWRDKLDRVSIHVPVAAQPIIDTLRARRHPDQPRRSGASSGHPLVRALVDPRRRDDVDRASEARPRECRARLSCLVRAVSVRERQSAMLRRRARLGSRARERQSRRAHLSCRSGLSLHARPRYARVDVAAS